MENTAWIEWGVPAVALLAGAVSLLAVWLSSRRFDRKYGKRPYGKGPYGR